MNFWNHLFYFNSNDPTLCYTLQRTTISANSLQYPFQFHSMPLAIQKYMENFREQLRASFTVIKKPRRLFRSGIPKPRTCSEFGAKLASGSHFRDDESFEFQCREKISRWIKH